MDTRVINFIRTKYNPESLDIIYVSDNKYNIPSKIYNKLNTTLTYNFMGYDNNGYTNDHLYMKRVFNGNMHNSDATIKFMKTLDVKVDTVENTDDLKHILTQRFSLPEKKDTTKELTRRVISIIDRFFHGDIEPDGIDKLDMYSDKVDIQYQIGSIRIYSVYYKHSKVTEYFVGIPYKAMLKTS